MKKIHLTLLVVVIIISTCFNFAQAGALSINRQTEVAKNPTPALRPITDSNEVITDTVQDLFPPLNSKPNWGSTAAVYSGFSDPTPFLKQVASNYFQQNFQIQISNPAITYGCWSDNCYWTANAILLNQAASRMYMYRLYLNTDGTLANPNGQPSATSGPLPGLQGSIDTAMVIVQEPCGLPVCTNIRDMVPQIQQTVASYNKTYANFLKSQHVTGLPLNFHLDVFFATHEQLPNYLDKQAVTNFASNESGGHLYPYVISLDLDLDHTNNSHAPLGCGPGNGFIDYSGYFYNLPRPVDLSTEIFPGKSALFLILRGAFEHEFFGHCLARWEHEWGGNEAQMFWESGTPFLTWTDPSLVGGADMQGDGLSPFLSSHPYNPFTQISSNK